MNLPPYIYGREAGPNEKVWTEAAVREAVAAYKAELFQKYESSTERATEAEGDAFTHGYLCGESEAVAAAVPEGFKLASDLLTALDDLVSACELPGDHCEIDQALPAVIRILESAKAMLSASPEVKP